MDLNWIVNNFRYYGSEVAAEPSGAQTQPQQMDIDQCPVLSTQMNTAAHAMSTPGPSHLGAHFSAMWEVSDISSAGENKM